MGTLQEVLGDEFAFTLRHLSEQEAMQLMSELGGLTPDDMMKHGTRWIFRYHEGVAALMVPSRLRCHDDAGSPPTEPPSLRDLTAGDEVLPSSDRERLFCALVAQVTAAVYWARENSGGPALDSGWICADKVR